MCPTPSAWDISSTTSATIHDVQSQGGNLVVIDTARSLEDRKALELFFARAAMGRPFVAPPGVPADFYARLPVLADFAAVTDAANFVPLPADWHVATCDVRNSTLAVEAGNYKHVNTVGAAAVTAMLNAAGSLEIPFIFEGDGSAFCVPPQLLADAKAALAKGLPVLGIGLGAQLLAIVAGGSVEQTDLVFEVGEARRVDPAALEGYLPERYPLVIYGRDRPVPPPDARILAVDAAGHPALFQVGANALGFTGHPGIKPAIVEDLVMEFEEGPEDPGPRLAELRSLQRSIEDALVPIMTGVVMTVIIVSNFTTSPVWLDDMFR